MTNLRKITTALCVISSVLITDSIAKAESNRFGYPIDTNEVKPVDEFKIYRETADIITKIRLLDQMENDSINAQSIEYQKLQLEREKLRLERERFEFEKRNKP
jgi:hypothetical protein